MKSIIFSFLFLSTTLSLFPFAAFSLTFTSENPIVLNGRPVKPVLPEVLDIDGDPLQVSQEYHVLSVTWGAGCGAIDLANIGNTKCPNAVVLHGGDSQLGLPVKFFISNPERTAKDIVRESTQINIMFSNPNIPNCDSGTFWMVGDPDMTARGLRFVVTNRVVLAPYGDFTIEKLTKKSPFYKIRYCPDRSLCPTCPCSDVGLTLKSRLALTNQPLTVVFKKVQKSTTDA